jgi:hypothetical protein
MALSRIASQAKQSFTLFARQLQTQVQLTREQRLLVAQSFFNVRFMQGLIALPPKGIYPIDTIDNHAVREIGVHHRGNVLSENLRRLASLSARIAYVNYLGHDLIQDVIDHTEWASEAIRKECAKLLTEAGFSSALAADDASSRIEL